MPGGAPTTSKLHIWSCSWGDQLVRAATLEVGTPDSRSPLLNLYVRGIRVQLKLAVASLGQRQARQFRRLTYAVETIRNGESCLLAIDTDLPLATDPAIPPTQPFCRNREKGWVRCGRRLSTPLPFKPIAGDGLFDAGNRLAWLTRFIARAELQRGDEKRQQPNQPVHEVPPHCIRSSGLPCPKRQE